MKKNHGRHYALVATLAYTGLRFCHASGLRWEDIDEERGIIRVLRKNVRGRVGPVSRKKRAPREYPLVPELADILREHRREMVETQAPGVESGYCFPSKWGTLRGPAGMYKAKNQALKAIGVTERFTIHGLRRTFNDLARRAGIDAVVTRSLTGHVTEKMREHYSTVGLDEKREAIARVVSLVRSGDPSGDRGGRAGKSGDGQ
jgi:integrase